MSGSGRTCYARVDRPVGVVLLVGAHRLLQRTSRGVNAKPMQLFHLSNSYLAFVFVAIAVDTFVR